MNDYFKEGVSLMIAVAEVCFNCGLPHDNFMNKLKGIVGDIGGDMEKMEKIEKEALRFSLEQMMK